MVPRFQLDRECTGGIGNINVSIVNDYLCAFHYYPLLVHHVHDGANLPVFRQEIQQFSIAAQFDLTEFYIEHRCKRYVHGSRRMILPDGEVSVHPSLYQLDLILGGLEIIIDRHSISIGEVQTTWNYTPPGFENLEDHLWLHVTVSLECVNNNIVCLFIIVEVENMHRYERIAHGISYHVAGNVQ